MEDIQQIGNQSLAALLGMNLEILENIIYAYLIKHKLT